MKPNTLFSLLAFTLVVACKPNNHGDFSFEVTPSEKQLCDSLGFDIQVAKEIKGKSQSNLFRLYYTRGGVFGTDGKEIISPSGYLNGLMIHAKSSASEPIMDALRSDLRGQGYSIFMVENHFGINGKDDDIAIVKDTCTSNLIKLIGTDGANYGIDNDSVISIVNSFSSRFGTQLVGVSGDWISLKITGGVSDWLSLAQEVEKIAPDVVSQGTGTTAALAQELEQSKSIYLWWD